MGGSFWSRIDRRRCHLDGALERALVSFDRTLSRKGELDLMALLFLHGMALASWFVPLGIVLDKAELGSIKSMAFAASAVAAMLSPLFFGAMADRSVPPARVLRWISIATAATVSLIAYAIESRWSSWSVLLLIQLQALFCSPTSSLAGSIVFARLVGSQRQFGTVRALGTIGWMAGCWAVSIFSLDASPRAFLLSGLLWCLLAAFTVRLSHEFSSAGPAQRLTLRERFGWDALSLFKDHNHRVVFITSALVAVPFAAFYPFTPPHLADLGLQRVSAWMSLGQISEVVALVCIGGILQRWKFKWVVSAGIAFGVLRYLFYATDHKWMVLLGLSLHGVAFTFTYISMQIYLAERIDALWRTRAQALLAMMTAGVGNLTGYLACGAWFTFCTLEGGVEWAKYWGWLCAAVILVLVYFSSSYRDIDTKKR